MLPNLIGEHCVQIQGTGGTGMVDRIEDREALWKFRAGWRRWFYDTVRRVEDQVGSLHLVTLTTRPEEVEYFDQRKLRDNIHRHRPDGLHALGTLERGRRGDQRIHAHLICAADSATHLLVKRWKDADLGWHDIRPIPDTLGVVYYITKAFGPETPWIATGRMAGCLTEVTGGLTAHMAGALTAVGATPAPEHAAAGEAVAGRLEVVEGLGGVPWDDVGPIESRTAGTTEALASGSH